MAGRGIATVEEKFASSPRCALSAIRCLGAVVRRKRTRYSWCKDLLKRRRHVLQSTTTHRCGDVRSAPLFRRSPCRRDGARDHSRGGSRDQLQRFADEYRNDWKRDRDGTYEYCGRRYNESEWEAYWRKRYREEKRKDRKDRDDEVRRRDALQRLTDAAQR